MRIISYLCVLNGLLTAALGVVANSAPEKLGRSPEEGQGLAGALLFITIASFLAATLGFSTQKK